MGGNSLKFATCPTQLVVRLLITPRNSLRKDIQSLRGFAVLSVIFFHLFPQVFYNGYLGVDIFFVISGYVVIPKILAIFQQSDKKQIKKNLLEFYKIRYFRLAPALAIVLIFFCFLILLIGPLQEQRYSTAQGISALTLTANLYADRVSANNYFQPNPNAFLHTWSLSVEEQIYLIVPILFFFIFLVYKKLLFKTYIYIFTSIFYLAYICILYNFLIPVDISSGSLYYSFVFRAWEFGLGGSLSTINFKFLSYKLKVFIWLLLIALILLPWSAAILPEISCIFALIFLNNELGFDDRLGILGLLGWLGNRSYSLYLVHLPVAFALQNNQISIGLDKLFLGLCSFLLTILLGDLCYRKIETKFRIYRKSPSTVTFIKSFYRFSIIPLIILVILRVGSTHFYFLTSSPQIQGTISCLSQINGVCSNNIINSKRTILLIGDSHAAAISKTFMKLMSDSKIKGSVISGRGCQVYETIANIKKNNCTEYRVQIIRYLKTNPNTDVLLFQRSSSIEFNRFRNTETYLNGILQGLKELQRYSEQVYVLGPNPEFPPGFSQGTFLNLFDNNGYFPRKKMVQNSFTDSEFFKRKLMSHDIRFYNSSNNFCDQNKCKFKSANKYLFWDENHLSLDGAEFIKNAIDELINS